MFAVLLVLLAVSAGCLGKSSPTETAASTDGPASSGVVQDNQTAAPDGRGDLAAFKETNRTVTNGTDSMDHKHDYWGGEDRKMLLQDDYGLIPIPLIPENKAPGTAIADFDLPEPFLVYEGTSHLEVLFEKVCVWVDITCTTNSHPAISIYVDYLTAIDDPGEFHEAGKATPGTPLIIPVAPTQADMPHQTKSLWLFRIYTGEVNAFSFNVTITAVKGGQVVNWPPHPDLYADRPERIVFEGPVTGESPGIAASFLYGDDANWVYPDRIISYGTDSIEVTVTRKAWNSATPEPAPEKFELQVNNASYIPKVGNGDPAGLRLTPKNIDGDTYTFDVPVDLQGYDTPYGTQSRWGFRFVPLEQRGLPWSHDYDMKIVARGHSIEAGGDGPKG